MNPDEMISLEDARDLVLSNVGVMPTEEIDVLDAVGRVCATPIKSDMNVSPFAHSAMDGFAVKSESLENASKENPVKLSVISEIGAGDVFEGHIDTSQCVRIMTGAELPEDADAVVKYEDVDYLGGDGKTGSEVSFSAPAKIGQNIRQAGDEAKAGEVIMNAGDVVSCAGVGYLVGCGALRIDSYKRPRAAVMATGSELVPPSEIPPRGHIRETNAYSIAACIRAAGCEASMLTIVKDDYQILEDAVVRAASEYDFVITTGGAANGDYDFIKKVVENKGDLLMTLVNMRPGKAQTFGIVNGTPVFGLPGNPAAAYCGFEMIIRPALRKMQGYTALEHPRVKAVLSDNVKKRDPRMILLRAHLMKDRSSEGFIVTPAKNQSSGLFGVIQKTNCLAVLPAGLESKIAGDEIECILLDIAEEIEL